MSFVISYYSEGAPPSLDDFVRLIEAEPFVEIDRNETLMVADYYCRDTSVAARMRYGFDNDGEREFDPDLGLYFTGFRFELQAPRPSYFGWEVIPLASRIAETLGLLVGYRPDERYIKPRTPNWLVIFNDYDEANRRMLEQMRKEGREEFVGIEKNRLRSWWDWMRELAVRQQALDDEALVCRIAFLRNAEATELVRISAWPDIIPALVGEIDYLVMSIERPSPEGLRQIKKSVSLADLKNRWPEISQQSELAPEGELLKLDPTKRADFLKWFDELTDGLPPEKYRLWPPEKAYDQAID